MDLGLSTSPIFLHKLPFRPVKQIIRIIPILYIPILSLIHPKFPPCFLQRLSILYMIKRTIKLHLFFTASHSSQMRLLIRRHRGHFIHPLHRFQMTPAMCINRLKILFPRILPPIFIINLQICLMLPVKRLQLPKTIKRPMFLKQRPPSALPVPEW